VRKEPVAHAESGARPIDGGVMIEYARISSYLYLSLDTENLVAASYESRDPVSRSLRGGAVIAKTVSRRRVVDLSLFCNVFEGSMSRGSAFLASQRFGDGIVLVAWCWTSLLNLENLWKAR
jgi:hypothetical protein